MDNQFSNKDFNLKSTSSNDKTACYSSNPGKKSDFHDSFQVQTQTLETYVSKSQSFTLLEPFWPSNEVEHESLSSISGREKLKKHRMEVAGRVLVPDRWGKEELLMNWIDYSSFDTLLVPNGIMSAREALVTEGRRPTSPAQMKVESSC